MDPKKVLSARQHDLPASLREGEEVLIKGQISNAIFWKAVVILIIAFLLGIVAPPLGYFICFVSCLAFAYGFILKSILMLIVTNQRIFFRSGIIKVDTVQVRLDRVESVEIQRTIVGHFLNYGTVVLTGTGSRFSYIPFLANAAQVRNVIDDLLYKRDKSNQNTDQDGN
ncbi:MAG TPA: PH domain-containing protein [Alphaproteobacteria bacterium]|jgi:uncharacterized membrane protein YdbT with pleckstrin-like domain|nr:PH domain-containing protein [Alphaproteobacteria bacterium]MCB9984490.1 PH domain-containing protein [Micavibrio sp.]HPQ50485.1 PH domain-containing protein [Alphaproteobacteria bacterium]HRK97745.1 PH domain-containing protein [Alphaproteobacteria bacterium]